MDAWEVPPPTPHGKATIAKVPAPVDTSMGMSGMRPAITGRGGAGVEEGLRTVSPLAGGRPAGTDRGQRVDDNGGVLPRSMSGAAEPADGPIGGGLGRLTTVAQECLVVSGALDRTLCLFRAGFGRGLILLRKLNVACSPRGLPGALIVGTPVEGAQRGVEGTQLEVIIIESGSIFRRRVVAALAGRSQNRQFRWRERVL